MKHRRRFTHIALLVLLGSPAGCARAQHLADVAPAASGPATTPLDSVAVASADSSVAEALAIGVAHFRSRTDSLNWVAAKRRAAKARGYRIVVSLFDRRLWVLSGEDTARAAPIAVASGATLKYNGREWTFRTPRGRRRVLRKDSLPIWIPPEWHYAEVAEEHGLKLTHLSAKRPTYISDGRALVVRDSLVGVIGPDSVFAPLPTDEEVVFDSTLYVPPVGTKNREIDGELGRYKLDLGEGYLLHGTPHVASIGRAATHGCIRLRDEDITWLFENVPIGTPVYIY